MAVSMARIADDFFGSVLHFRDAPEQARPSLSDLRNQLLGQLESIEKQVPDRAEFRELQFALIAFADQAVMNSNWSGVEEWKRSTLSSLVLDVPHAGNEFFRRLERLPREQADARAIYFLCLAFGFQGEYAGDQAGLSELIRANYELLRDAGHATDASNVKQIAPQAYDVEIEQPHERSGRVWLSVLGIVAVAAAIYGLIWIGLWYAAGEIPLVGVR